MSKRIHVVFKGRVQGVGFRFTAEEKALEHDLTGWVMNIASGDVELIAEGKEADLKKFLDSMSKSRVGPMIKQSRIAWLAATGEFNDFRIEYAL